MIKVRVCSALTILTRFIQPGLYNQLNVCTTSVTEGEVAGVKLVEAPTIITDRSKAVVLMWYLLDVLVSEFR